MQLISVFRHFMGLRRARCRSRDAKLETATARRRLEVWKKATHFDYDHSRHRIGLPANARRDL